jgi:hypothetical protein
MAGVAAHEAGHLFGLKNISADRSGNVEREFDREHHDVRPTDKRSVDRMVGARLISIAGGALWLVVGAGSPIVYGGVRHYHLDHLGSVRLVTNGAGKW